MRILVNISIPDGSLVGDGRMMTLAVGGDVGNVGRSLMGVHQRALDVDVPQAKRMADFMREHRTDWTALLVRV